jgi:hypothetical protein
MGARQWVAAAMAGVAGFAVTALAISMVVAPRQTGYAEGVAAIGGPFMLVDDIGAPNTMRLVAAYDDPAVARARSKKPPEWLVYDLVGKTDSTVTSKLRLGSGHG